MSNTDKDLTVSRVIKAPRSAVWKAWKDPAHFVKWFAPKPVVTTSIKHEFHAGGAFATAMRLEDGTEMDCGEGCFLEVIENERIVFTDALSGGWRPNETSFFTAVIMLEEHPEGTLYTATAKHKNDADRQKHDEMGFMDGWGTTIDQLGALAADLA